MTPTHILTTSLAEIRSFQPCASGWKDILTARKPISDEDYNIQFPLVDCLESNSIADVCWLLGKRKEEVQICVRFAQMCADSVQEIKNRFEVYAANAYADAAANAAADAAAYANAAAAYANADAAAYANADAAYAANAAADAAHAAYAAADAAAAADAYAAYANAYAAAADAANAAAYDKQKELNKQFLIQCINEY